jgi:hypothetical protein
VWLVDHHIRGLCGFTWSIGLYVTRVEAQVVVARCDLSARCVREILIVWSFLGVCRGAHSNVCRLSVVTVPTPVCGFAGPVAQR